jgi:hypothetical protein
MLRMIQRSAGILPAIALLLWSGCSGRSSDSVAAGQAPAVTLAIDSLRAATRPYLLLDSAVAVGYPRDVPDCLVHEQHGAMGYHHVNRNYVDAKLDLQKPEILLYERLSNGEYRLNGVEFIMPYRNWPRDSIAPVFLGQTFKREDNLNFWYVHVWAWTQNSDGLFADFNPRVKCAPGSAKVFKPFIDPARIRE